MITGQKHIFFIVNFGWKLKNNFQSDLLSLQSNSATFQLIFHHFKRNVMVLYLQGLRNQKHKRNLKFKVLFDVTGKFEVF